MEIREQLKIVIFDKPSKNLACSCNRWWPRLPTRIDDAKFGDHSYSGHTLSLGATYLRGSDQCDPPNPSLLQSSSLNELWAFMLWSYPRAPTRARNPPHPDLTKNLKIWRGSASTASAATHTRERVESFLCSPCSRSPPAASHIPGFARVHSWPPLNQTVSRI